MATSAGGLPYVETSDLVSGYPAVSELLAETLDSQLAAKAALASPAFTGSPTLNGSPLAGGLAYITSGTVAAGSSLSINSCFSAAFDQYLVVIGGVTSADVATRFRLRAAGVDASAANYTYQSLTASATVLAGSRTSGTTAAELGGMNTDAGGTLLSLWKPFIATPTVYRATNAYTSSGAYIYEIAGQHTLSTSYDGISIYPASGTETITARVYGYKNS